jgi:pilus assembly protein CpaB
MALRSLLYAVMTLALAGFLGVAWLALHPPAPASAPIVAAPPPPQPRPRVAVLAAARPLHAGALLGVDDLAAREVEQVAPDMVADTPATRASLFGGMVRHDLPAGALLHPDSVLRPGDRGFLAAVLHPGMRAVSIGVDPVSGAAGLVWPGDTVDLVLTLASDDAARPVARRISGETMLSGVRVIAIDQQLMHGVVGGDGAERAVRTVTLEVTPAEAERIAVGARMGRLSLAVHAALPDTPPPSSPSPATPPAAVTWAGDVSSALPGAAQGGAPVRLYRGPDKTEEMHF